MEFNIFCMRDEAAAAFLTPQVDQTDESAIRNFQYALAQNGLMSFKKSDFSLWCLGTFDNKTGIISPAQPRLLVRGEE